MKRRACLANVFDLSPGPADKGQKVQEWLEQITNQRSESPWAIISQSAAVVSEGYVLVIVQLESQVERG